MDQAKHLEFEVGDRNEASLHVDIYQEGLWDDTELVEAYDRAIAHYQGFEARHDKMAGDILETDQGEDVDLRKEHSSRTSDSITEGSHHGRIPLSQRPEPRRPRQVSVTATENTRHPPPSRLGRRPFASPLISPEDDETLASSGWPKPEMSGQAYIPPPPPPPVLGVYEDADEIETLMVAWYNAGYYAGYYAGRKSQNVLNYKPHSMN
eukprot:CAMPEP_0184680486 /NCGR_PEP_ID=MMETSP0312-20130426/3365_1 /TAXON_ID=31354 /ORGANISM="Compsopogon coeruleus, Strain SAG 36.94" /LENGTH=207 /DNA_ID=CAMNT_0027130619 /DNA_START=110 /DNA_END=733 /DNA_ORIENTATION=+